METLGPYCKRWKPWGHEKLARKINAVESECTWASIADKVGPSLVHRPLTFFFLVCVQYNACFVLYWAQTKERKLGRPRDEAIDMMLTDWSLVFPLVHFTPPLSVSLSVQAVIGEADLRLQELKKLQYEFERDVVRGAINPVSQIVW